MCQVPENMLTTELVNHPRCDKLKFDLQTHKISYFGKKSWAHARFLFVFEDGDLMTAAHYLAEQMHEPFEPFPICCVAVEQTVHDDFIERVRSRFHQVKPHVATDPSFEQTRRELEMGNIKHIVAREENAPSFASPIIVTDKVTHLYFSNTPSGVVTLKSFKNIKEAGDIFTAETPQFDAAFVFDEGITSVYSLAARISCVHFYVNCFDVCIMPILPYYGLREPHVMLHNGFHYETLELGKEFRIIVFPYSTTLVRRCCCSPNVCTCRIAPKILYD